MCVYAYARCKTSLGTAPFVLDTNTSHWDVWKFASTSATLSWQSHAITHFFCHTSKPHVIFSRDATEGQFCGLLPEEPHMFSIRALNTEGWQRRLVRRRESKENRKHFKYNQDAPLLLCSKEAEVPQSFDVLVSRHLTAWVLLPGSFYFWAVLKRLHLVVSGSTPTFWA